MNLSQAEIDALLSGGGDGGSDAAESEAVESEAVEDTVPETLPEPEDGVLGEGYGGLSPIEIDTLGEVGNMCMGAAATTMYTLLDRRVEITTPRVSVHTTRDVLSMYKVPFVVVEVEYTEGIHGKNLLLFKEHDAALITDVLMGGEGVVEEPVELSELHMSAINEIMNQMIGASATALSQVINMPVNISTPNSQHMTLDSSESSVLGTEDLVILINFDMEIENLLKSQLVQLMPYDQGRAMSAMLVSSNEQAAQEISEATVTAEPAPAYEAPPAAPTPAPPPLAAGPVDVRPAQYDSFAPLAVIPDVPPGAFNMVHDIPLQVSVELGKTKKEISEILNFDMGTVVVLDKTAGDPVEILVNGKLVACGEVVVIDENYGVRITQLYN